MIELYTWIEHLFFFVSKHWTLYVACADGKEAGELGEVSSCIKVTKKNHKVADISASSGVP